MNNNLRNFERSGFPARSIIELSEIDNKKLPEKAKFIEFKNLWREQSAKTFGLNCLIVGKDGMGKTTFLTWLAREAFLKNGYARYLLATGFANPDLVKDVEQWSALRHVHLLCIDEVQDLQRFSPQAFGRFLEIFKHRHNAVRGTVVTANFDFEQCKEYLHDIFPRFEMVFVL